MKFLSAITLLALVSSVSATDWEYPEPTTYTWTIHSATQTKIPEVNFEDIEVGRVIEILGANSMTFPLRIDASQVADEKLKKRITIHQKDISWIEILALAADEIDADILIAKGKVILTPSQIQPTK